MKKRIFTGAGVAIVTPMNKDGGVNYDKLKELIEEQIAEKTDAIIICGTTGESPTLSNDEHVKAIECAVKTANSRVPVVAGAGSNDTSYAVSLSKEAEHLGVDGLLIVTPYYNKASQIGLVRHYNKIADSVSIPVIVYDVPSRTGVHIAPETFFELSKHENIVAVKAASGDISQVASIRALCGDDLDVYSGNDDQITPILSLGGIGVISVLSNVVPKLTHDICQYYFDGKVKESAALQLKLLDLAHALFVDVNPIPVKEAMNMMGKDVGECRLPLGELTTQKMEILKNVLIKHQLI